MGKNKNLYELIEKNIEEVKNRPAISIFSNNMSLGAVLEKAYITPKYYLHKHGIHCTGIEPIYKEYNNKNIIFIGQGGTGKTTSFLRLYTGTATKTNDIIDKQFYYCFAPDLQGDKRSLNAYQKHLRKAIEAGTKLNGILLLDGLEEAFWNNRKQANVLLEQLGKSNITFWVSCRTSFYQMLDESVNYYFDERIEVESWIPEDFDRFVDCCLEKNENKIIIKERISKVKKQVVSLLVRPLFATIILFIAENNELDDVYNEYELIELFLKQWLHRENTEKNIDEKINYKSIRNVALSVYLRTDERPKYDKSLSAFRDLLVMTNAKKGSSIHGFYHREFLVYFICNALIDAALSHPDRIIWWFSQTFYDDITNLIKPVLNRMDHQKINIMYENLFSIYRRTYEDTDSVNKSFIDLKLSPKESFLKLRDEIIYFISKLPDINYSPFFHYAYKKSTDTMLFMGIAYGMASLDPNNQYTLEFAKELKPGTKEDIRNRGWGMCFFGDVEENGYEYEDTEQKPWKKVRENRLKRLSNDLDKYCTRTLDLPLLYCYYYSRDFKDCISYRDYTIIRNANITLNYFGEAQKIFMLEQKTQLVSAYLKHLLLEEIKSRISLVSISSKESIKMQSDTGQILLEIDNQLTQKILEQVELREGIIENIKLFWDKHGTKLVEEYKPKLNIPVHNNLTYEEFNERIMKCKVLIITANSIEGAIVTQHLMQANNENALDAYPLNGHLHQFATINSIPILHIWASDTSSYTQYGSFSAVDAALEKFTPKYVMSVGVAFGINPEKQSLGDVLVAKQLVFYDNFNKVTDGRIKFKPQETYRTDANLSAQVHQLDIETPLLEPGEIDHFESARNDQSRLIRNSQCTSMTN